MARTPSTRFVFQPVQLVRPAEVVAYRISEAIRAGDVKVGERLPSEQNLSEQLGVSRPTLREAIKLLVQASVLNVLPGSSGVSRGDGRGRSRSGLGSRRPRPVAGPSR